MKKQEKEDHIILTQADNVHSEKKTLGINAMAFIREIPYLAIVTFLKKDAFSHIL